ncbi:MAG: hypothetical protein JWP81_2740 [Ferruginibacter sp.]|nr:hypothetical protein [Ferruginibacter sp.]
MLRVILLGTLVLIGSVSFIGVNRNAYPQKLSDWQIFEDKLSLLHPKPGVVPYTLNTTLYSDYAEKARFVRLPAGTSVNYKPRGVLDFPIGTLLIKTFYYSADFRKPGINKKIIETRLLIREANEWKAITYVWNDEQTEAFLEIAGDDKQVSFIDKEGTTRQVRYVIPNQNQCKGCHNVNDILEPIGPTIGQLNGKLAYSTGVRNQIDYWKAHKMLLNVPATKSIPKTAVWDDPATGDLNIRARAYLAVNCAHCHRREGPAQTSGLFLNEEEKDPTAIGINKAPVAAGKGSGGRMVDILPGDANASITWYRMQTQDPGERMPELGRNLVHKEGVALVRDWINNMK